MTCEACGAGLAPDARFCVSCGSRVAASETGPGSVLVLPTWLSSGWGEALAVGALAPVILFGFLLLVAVIGVVAQVVGGSSLDLADSGFMPVTLMPVIHGAGDAGWWATGILLVGWAIRLALRSNRTRLAEVVGGDASPLDLLAFALRGAVIYGLIVGLVSLLDPVSLGGLVPESVEVPLAEVVRPRYDVAAPFVLAFVVGFILLAIFTATQFRPAWIRRLWQQIPGRAYLEAGWAGLRRSLRITLPSLLIAAIAGAVWTILDRGRDIAERLIVLLAGGVGLSGLDVAGDASFASLSFDQDAIRELLPGIEGWWVFVGSAVVALAIALGGHRAASTAGRTAQEKVISGAFVGVLFGLVIMAFYLLGFGVLDATPAAGLGLGIVFAAVGAAGGFVEGVRSGAIVASGGAAGGRHSPRAATLPPPGLPTPAGSKFCGTCGVELLPNSLFCAECGTPVEQLNGPVERAEALVDVAEALEPEEPSIEAEAIETVPDETPIETPAAVEDPYDLTLPQEDVLQAVREASGNPWLLTDQEDNPDLVDEPTSGAPAPSDGPEDTGSCQGCGDALTPDDVFCGECGHPVG